MRFSGEPENGQKKSSSFVLNATRLERNIETSKAYMKRSHMSSKTWEEMIAFALKTNDRKIMTANNMHSMVCLLSYLILSSLFPPVLFGVSRIAQAGSTALDVLL